MVVGISKYNNKVHKKRFLLDPMTIFGWLPMTMYKTDSFPIPYNR